LAVIKDAPFHRDRSLMTATKKALTEFVSSFFGALQTGLVQVHFDLPARQDAPHRFLWRAQTFWCITLWEAGPALAQAGKLGGIPQSLSGFTHYPHNLILN
jgi:hypothetical protein